MGRERSQRSLVAHITGGLQHIVVGVSNPREEGPRFSQYIGLGETDG